MLKKYPRPQFKRSDYVLLNGTWDFQFDDNRVGLKEKWYINKKFNKKIEVPYVFESKLSGINDRSQHPYIWYKRQIEIPKAWVNKRIIINFMAVDYESTLYVNGQMVGKHIGGNTSFSFDITDYLNYNDDEIVLYVVDNPVDQTQPRGKQFWEEASRVIWYTRSSGIWQSVFLEAVDKNHIQNYKVTPDIDKGVAHFEVFTTNVSDELSLHVKIENDNILIQDVTYALNESTIKFTLDIFKDDVMKFAVHSHGLCWTPENPVLFDLEFKLLNKNNEVLDQVNSYFGMRKIHTENGHIYLNNHKYYMKLVLDQGYWPEGLLTPHTDEDYELDIKLAKQMGFNGARKHQKVESSQFLSYADKLGFLVWGEYASSAQYGHNYVKAIHNEWADIIKRDYNHPSIVTWVPLNESWGVPQIGRDPMQQAHSISLYYYVKSLDQTRLVISNDGWEMTETDIIGIHHYNHATNGDQAKHLAYVNSLSSRENLINHPSTNRNIFVGGYKDEGQPILLTEMGGAAFGIDENKYGYTSVESKEEFETFLKRIFEAIYNANNIVGFGYTQLTDVEQEINGLLTYDRKPKIALDKIKKTIDNY